MLYQVEIPVSTTIIQPATGAPDEMRRTRSREDDAPNFLTRSGGVVMHWWYLLVAGLLEVGWAIGLKYTDGFTKPLASVLTAAAIVGSMILLSLAAQDDPHRHRLRRLDRHRRRRRRDAWHCVAGRSGHAQPIVFPRDVARGGDRVEGYLRPLIANRQEPLPNKQPGSCR